MTKDNITEGKATAGGLSNTAPVGWKIVSMGDDGSVLCDGPSGQRERFWLLGRAEEISQLEAENNRLRKANKRFIAAMKAGDTTIGKCRDCGCDVATWNTGNAVLCCNCDTNEEK